MDEPTLNIKRCTGAYHPALRNVLPGIQYEEDTICCCAVLRRQAAEHPTHHYKW